MRTLPTLLLAFAVAIVQTSLGLSFRQTGFMPDLMSMFVAYVLLQESGVRSIGLSWAIGLIRDCFSAQPFGLFAGLYAVAGYFIGGTKLPVYQKHIASRLLAVAVIVALTTGAEAVLCTLAVHGANHEAVVSLSGRVVLCTLVLTPPVFALLDRIVKWLGATRLSASAPGSNSTS